MLRSCIKAILLLSALMLLAGCTSHAKYMKVENDAVAQMEHMIANHPDYAGKIEVKCKHGNLTVTIVDTGQPSDLMTRRIMGGWVTKEWDRLMDEMGGRKNWKGDLVYQGKSELHWSKDEDGKLLTDSYGIDSM